MIRRIMRISILADRAVRQRSERLALSSLYIPVMWRPDVKHSLTRAVGPHSYGSLVTLSGGRGRWCRGSATPADHGMPSLMIGHAPISLARDHCQRAGGFFGTDRPAIGNGTAFSAVAP
jgi:hypothetical protein